MLKIEKFAIFFFKNRNIKKCIIFVLLPEGDLKLQEKMEILEGELDRIKNSLTKKLYDSIKENSILKEKIKELNSIIESQDKKVEACLKEIGTLQDAFELLLSDWIEELEKRGISPEEILNQRESFNKVMYWKQGKQYEK